MRKFFPFKKFENLKTRDCNRPQVEVELEAGSSEAVQDCDHDAVVQQQSLL